MKKIIISIISGLVLSAGAALGQTYVKATATNEIQTLIQEESANSNQSVLEIKKCFRSGNAENLSEWFDDNLEISIFSESSTSSKIQARQIMKSFFKEHKPNSFSINNIVERANLKYMLADLDTIDEHFNVVVFLSGNKDEYRIQQIIISKKR